ncbi:hypothetical protein QQZ08_001930 [Neonectria magnoliae]|uniref:C2H2-type domain-containing protein n=1 Tax=Neonectria magnoliae TaxID=2732573 RepID=A0ABR1IE01_9HYPO
MDGSQYPPNGVNTTSSGQTYPSPTAIAPNQLQTGSPLPQTLPPLQPPASAMQPLYGSHPHTPRTPGTPNTPGSTGLPSYQQTSQPGGRGGIYSMPQSQYPPPQQYGTSGAMMPQATTSASHPQPIAPAPVGGRGPPVLRPMPPGGIMSQPGVSSPYGPSSLMQPNSVLQHEGEQPTHVVGSQGRRGILPSAPGRPAAPAAGTGATKNTVIPVKDADGKFPCPHCTKTYLHAKHLKRHLLRHTGDRPYMCVLCRDTFSRSDILKRHFQKCSIRRGNPTGASHLSHPQAHVKKNAQAQKAAGLGHDGDLNHLNGLSNIPGDNMVHPFGMVPVQDGMNNMAGDQNHLSRSSSIGRLDNGNNGDRRNMPVMGGSQPYGNDVSSSMQQQQLPGYSMPPGQNGMPMYGGSNQNQQSGLDWSQMFQAGAHQTYVNTSFIPNLGQTQIATKTEPNAEPGTTGARPSSPIPSNWGMPSNLQNSYNQLSDQILNFFYPPNQAIDPQSAGMNLYFSPDNIKDFLDKFTHFNIHVPVLHVATFKIVDAYTGLLAGMCCIGACYSDRVTSSNVREMMDFLCLALERDCKVFSTELRDSQPRIASQSDIEELQAVMFMCMLLIWNGTPQQRDRARQIHPYLASNARKFNLFQSPQNPYHVSPLHQVNSNSNNFSPKDFSWEIWIDQERRNRLMFAIFLCDIAMGLYFNSHPLFDVFEIHLPLPCDDAAWDADKAEDCVSALGLNGSDAARVQNAYGTQRPKQPVMDWAIKALLHPSYGIQPGSTNLYGKFILIHGLLSLIRQAQVGGNAFNYETPPPSDWMTPAGAHSRRGSPVNGTSQNADPQSLQRLNGALDKFKSNWDADMSSQFPPTTPVANNPRRHGFSRDGIHFYWLAKYMLQHTRPAELQMAPDVRFMQVMQLLKSVRAWVMSDGASRGEELGSVGEIDDQYGAMDLTLEMACLFTPQVVGAGAAAVKTELDIGGR